MSAEGWGGEGVIHLSDLDRFDFDGIVNKALLESRLRLLCQTDRNAFQSPSYTVSSAIS